MQALLKEKSLEQKMSGSLTIRTERPSKRTTV